LTSAHRQRGRNKTELYFSGLIIEPGSVIKIFIKNSGTVYGKKPEVVSISDVGV